MKLVTSNLSQKAAQLLKQKENLLADDYQNQLEAFVLSIANLNADHHQISFHDELGLMEKMSFEIRTPMNSILGFTGLLKDSFFTLEEKEDFIQLIEKNTELLVQLLNDLNDLTKIENFQIPIKIKEFELNVFILNIISDFQEKAKEKNIHIEKIPNTKIKDNICIATDPYHLRHIIDNLLSNLINISKNNKISLKVEIENNAFLNIEILNENVEIPETISNSIIKHISHSLSETNFDGTGLRLTLTKALVDLLNGEIEFKSLHHKGSLFLIKIPVLICKLQK